MGGGAWVRSSFWGVVAANGVGGPANRCAEGARGLARRVHEVRRSRLAAARGWWRAGRPSGALLEGWWRVDFEGEKWWRMRVVVERGIRACERSRAGRRD